MYVIVNPSKTGKDSPRDKVKSMPRALRAERREKRARSALTQFQHTSDDNEMHFQNNCVLAHTRNTTMSSL